MITPRQARGEAFIRSEVDKLEPQIDRWLQEETLRGKERIFYATRNLEPAVVLEIIHRYQANGWLVDEIHDARDGNALEFIAPR